MPKAGHCTKKSLHLVSFLLLWVLIIWDRIVNIPKFPYCFCYLTQIDLYLNAIYFLLSLIDYKLPRTNSLDKYFNFCFGIAFTVFMMFWGLFFTNRNTLFKPGIELSYTLIILLHGGVFFICFVEQMYSNPRQKPLYLHPLVYLVFTFLYGSFLRLIYTLFKIKVYPFVYGEFYLFIIICTVGWLVTLIGHYLYYFLSNSVRKENQGAEVNKREIKDQYEQIESSIKL